MAFLRGDLLQGGGTTTAQALADGVIQMRALYGLDTNGDGILDAWADPGATGYDIATVMTTTATLRQIVAVRVALVMRSASKERDPVSSASLTLFGDAVDAAKKSLAQTVSLNGTDDQNYRYRVVDFTVPLRNMLLLP